MRKIVFASIIILISILVGCSSRGNIKPINVLKPLFVNTASGVFTIDTQDNRIVGQPITLGSNIFAIAASKETLFLSDSGDTDLPFLGGDALYVIKTKQGNVDELKAPGADNLAINDDKLYGLVDGQLLFEFNTKRKKLIRKFKIEDDINIAGFTDKILVYSGKTLYFLDAEKPKLRLEQEINQAVVYKKKNKAMVALLAGGILKLVDAKRLKMVREIKLEKLPVDGKIFVNNNKLYYPNSSTSFLVLDLNANKIAASILLPFEPNNVISIKDKLYFTFLGGQKGSNIVGIFDTHTNKLIKNLTVGEDASGAILIGDYIYVANSGSISISIISTNIDKVIKTVKLESDPITFATSLPSVQAVELGL